MLPHEQNNRSRKELNGKLTFIHLPAKVAGPARGERSLISSLGHVVSCAFDICCLLTRFQATPWLQCESDANPPTAKAARPTTSAFRPGARAQVETWVPCLLLLRRFHGFPVPPGVSTWPSSGFWQLLRVDHRVSCPEQGPGQHKATREPSHSQTSSMLPGRPGARGPHHEGGRQYSRWPRENSQAGVHMASCVDSQAVGHWPMCPG